MEGVLLEIAKQGVLGLVAVLAVIIAFKKDKQVSALHDRLEAKSDKMADKYYTLATELKETMQALTDSLEE